MDRLARGKLWLGLSNGGHARSSPGNQRRRACLPSSVLARAQPLIVRVVFLVPAADRNTGVSVGGSRMAHGLTGWRLAVPGCNFDTACLIGPWR